MIGTLEAYVKIRDYFGKDVTVPIYVEIDDGERLARALKRERQPENQKYEEMCRRFLADAADFSEDKIKEAGIERRFQNDDLENTLLEIKEYIESLM
jgi:guanylate kinase